eukprot:gene25821-biopygen7521
MRERLCSQSSRLRPPHAPQMAGRWADTKRGGGRSHGRKRTCEFSNPLGNSPATGDTAAEARPERKQVSQVGCAPIPPQTSRDALRPRPSLADAEDALGGDTRGRGRDAEEPTSLKLEAHPARPAGCRPDLSVIWTPPPLLQARQTGPRVGDQGKGGEGCYNSMPRAMLLGRRHPPR